MAATAITGDRKILKATVRPGEVAGWMVVEYDFAVRENNQWYLRKAQSAQDTSEDPLDGEAVHNGNVATINGFTPPA